MRFFLDAELTKDEKSHLGPYRPSVRAPKTKIVRCFYQCNSCWTNFKIESVQFLQACQIIENHVAKPLHLKWCFEIPLPPAQCCNLNTLIEIIPPDSFLYIDSNLVVTPHYLPQTTGRT